MRGILIIVARYDDRGNELESPNFNYVDLMFERKSDNTPFGDSIEGALAFVIQSERDNINFDMAHADDEGRCLCQENLEKIKQVAWPQQPNDKGHYVIESVWAGGLKEDGFDYRFIPVEI